ncbi:MAG: hypothetical protein IKR43_01245 [Lachnospiraceae bacterium]|nr:hypothetical protein [Lachnospiraceae bacterium]
MGLFDKILSGNKDVQSIINTVSDAANILIKEANKAAAEKASASSSEGGPLQGPFHSVPAESYEEAESGFSWGPVMPDEENQFNYPGPFYEYFDKVFSEEFPEYQISRKRAPYGVEAYIITFRKNGQTALIVELLSRSSEPDKLRSDCRRNGTPYLRYYYDYDGWWNTREYVKQRTRNALKF